MAKYNGPLMGLTTSTLRPDSREIPYTSVQRSAARNMQNLSIVDTTTCLCRSSSCSGTTNIQSSLGFEQGNFLVLLTAASIDGKEPRVLLLLMVMLVTH